MGDSRTKLVTVQMGMHPQPPQARPTGTLLALNDLAGMPLDTSTYRGYPSQLIV